ncbi:3-methyl-2-oxobutanoate hydroxymethyltransferase [Candidatus Bathyarchaeota archaeon]|nr:3-methyl-2-oxobutanoate hydroxymethyltransferase [Candidatus Bathyarchaeota archaeon]
MKIEQLRNLKSKKKVTMLTAYDYRTAEIMDQAGIDMILVGDSLGMVVLGYDDTRHVSMEDMVRHIGAVARGTKRAIIVGDMPIDTYNTADDALLNARRLIEAGAIAVKFEGNKPEVVKAIISSGIPVMGHLGLLPQTAEKLKVQGKTETEANRILCEAKQLDSLGVFSIVLECVPMNLARQISESIQALTIGIGAGPYCDGQVLVVNDMLGLDPEFKPKHVKQYANLSEGIQTAVKNYIKDVEEGKFPSEKHSFH